MSKFENTGIEEIMRNFVELSEIPIDVQKSIVGAGGEVVKQAHQAQLDKLKLVDSGKLKNSIKVFHKRGRQHDFQRYVMVYPAGDHHTYLRRLETRTYANSASGRTYQVGGDVQTATNDEVGFVHEFGAPQRGVKAKYWMKKANATCGEALLEAEKKAFYAWLDSINL